MTRHGRTAGGLAGTGLTLGLLLGAAPLRAADPAAVEAFVEANMVAAFYHEAAHAMIDTLDLTVAAEEDAADALATILIDRLQDEGAGVALVRANALAYRLFEARGPQPFRGAHSPDRRRHDRLVCLFYGADPDRRQDLAEDLGLPAAQRHGCPAAWQAAAGAWGAMLADRPPQDHLAGFRMVAGEGPLAALVAREVEALNGEYGLPHPIDVTVERCGEANAFYDPRARRIVMCLDYAEGLARLYRAAVPGDGAAAP